MTTATGAMTNMNEVHFCYWLQGFFDAIEISPSEAPTDSFSLIESKLDLVEARVKSSLAVASRIHQPHPLAVELTEMRFLIKHQLPIQKFREILDRCFADHINPQHSQEFIGSTRTFPN
jgi:hypothetical protein